MNRLPLAPLLLAGAALLGGCFDLSNPNVGTVRLSPILDSMFVDDTLSTGPQTMPPTCWTLSSAALPWKNRQGFPRKSGPRRRNAIACPC